MATILKAALAYVAIVFVVGFAFGVVRTLAVEPLAGRLAAVAIELPFMLAVSWYASRYVATRYSLPARIAPRLATGMIAFALLMVFELGLSLLLFHRSIADHLATYGEPPEALGFLAQLLFAFIPALQARLAIPPPSKATPSRH